MRHLERERERDGNEVNMRQELAQGGKGERCVSVAWIAIRQSQEQSEAGRRGTLQGGDLWNSLLQALHWPWPLLSGKEAFRKILPTKVRAYIDKYSYSWFRFASPFDEQRRKVHFANGRGAYIGN